MGGVRRVDWLGSKTHLVGIEIDKNNASETLCLPPIRWGLPCILSSIVLLFQAPFMLTSPVFFFLSVQLLWHYLQLEALLGRIFTHDYIQQRDALSRLLDRTCHLHLYYLTYLTTYIHVSIRYTPPLFHAILRALGLVCMFLLSIRCHTMMYPHIRDRDKSATGIGYCSRALQADKAQLPK